MGNELKCKNCVYCWQDEDEDFPSCHCEKTSIYNVPPCEEEEYDEYDEEYDEYDEEF